MIYGYLGHHKSASSWMSRQIIKSATEKMGLNYEHYPNPKAFDNNLEHHVIKNKVNFFAYVNANIEFIGDITKKENFKGFHIIRDPRDICISAYFSHLYSHPVNTKYTSGIAALKQKLESVSLEEGLFLEMEFLGHIFTHMINWEYNHPNVLEIKFEELVQAPYNSILKIFNFLGLIDEDNHSPGNKISPYDLLKIIYDKRFEKMSQGRNIGDEDQKSHYRKGIAGDWQNYFNKRHKDFFKSRYKELLLKLGYENDSNW